MGKKRVSINPDYLTIDETDHWYRLSREGLEHVRQQILHAVGVSLPAPREFVGLTVHEASVLLDEIMAAHDEAATLRLISGLEALFRVDFFNRVYDRRKDDVSRAFREIYDARQDHRFSLNDDILSTWSEVGGLRPLVRELAKYIKYRHWLAHGQYWTPKFGAALDYAGAYLAITSLLTQMPGGFRR